MVRGHVGFWGSYAQKSTVVVVDIIPFFENIYDNNNNKSKPKQGCR